MLRLICYKTVVFKYYRDRSYGVKGALREHSPWSLELRGIDGNSGDEQRGILGDESLLVFVLCSKYVHGQPWGNFYTSC